ncbi:class I SAM-dependent methyltransferase [Mycolicibacterium pyrenivorans]|uniref:class I SAM-dependent methyltransferase n=1 Tax=Mycolicibacterium pyrenivorans TaxID=187102 RepID=UPI0021F2FFDB|nr:class I SAM-dependent methyltransferase [Mycolicibacterium pyrenivorans]
MTDRDGASRGTFAEFTPAAAHDYDAWFDRPWGAHAWAVELAAVDDALPDRPDQTVVEVGCGTGRLIAHLTKRAATVVGVDSSPAMLAVATGRAPGRLVCADGRRLPFPDGVADVAITIATLEFADAAAVLEEMARITRPGGRIIALTLNPVSPWGLLDRPTRRAPFSTAAFLTRSELRRLGSRHGRARLAGRLFTSAQPGLRRLEPIATVVGAGVPWFGAVQVLVVDRPIRRCGRDLVRFSRPGNTAVG